MRIGSEAGIITGLGQQGRRIAVTGKVVRMDVKATESLYLFGIKLAREGNSYKAWKSFFVV